MEKPLVSIITITHNRGDLIGRCIKSVLGQTYRNIEHIVIDGASDDNTDKVVSSFDDNRLKYIKLDSNWSVVKTINYGVEQSTGQFITFLDSDDEYLPAKVEKQLNKILTLPDDYGMVYCWMTYYDQKTMKVDHIHCPQIRGDVSRDVVEKPVVSGTPTYFFRREAFIANGGWKEVDEIGIISDWEMAARFCQKWKVDYVPESLINIYVNHEHQRMSSRGYYKDFWKRNVKFHKYMLKEFARTFKHYPNKMIFHLRMLVSSNIMIGDYKSAFILYIKLLKISKSFRDIMIIPIYLIKKINYGIK